MAGWLRPLGAVLVAALLVSALPDCSCFAVVGAAPASSGHECCSAEAGLRAAPHGCCDHDAQPADGPAVRGGAPASTAPAPSPVTLDSIAVATGLALTSPTARRAQPSAAPPVLRI